LVEHAVCRTGGLYAPQRSAMAGLVSVVLIWCLARKPFLLAELSYSAAVG